MSTVSYKEYPAPEIDRGEILRYMGSPQSSDELDTLIEKCLLESAPKLTYKVICTEAPLSFEKGLLRLGELTVESRNLKKNLEGCCRAVIFAATVGLGIDREIMKYSRIAPASALCMQAIGTERIEALCNTFCNELSQKLAEESCALRPRFSPGYGDLPIEFQREIFGILECEKLLGLTLNDSLLMSPTKSVTAIVGIYNKTEKQ